MEENQNKHVGRPLSTDEIRQLANKWSLAGDVGLLAHLELFSNNLFEKCQETQKNINSLLDSLEDTSTTINNVTNQFLALQNSQFVENRVYDDESPVEEQKSDTKLSKEEQEKYLLAQYKEAVEIGVKLLDSHFEEVQLLPNSDSDEEEGSLEIPGLVWKPKNPYADKRFPLLIGSAEWWADDNVGLGEYEENLNPGTVSSESEDDMEVEDTVSKRIRMSSSSSTESEKILNKKLKSQTSSGYDDIFAPSHKDLPKVQPLGLKADEIVYEDLDKRQNIFGGGNNMPVNNKGKEQNEVDEKINFQRSKPSKSSLFDDNEDSEEEDYSESHTYNAKPNRISNAFTKELAAKLSSVNNKNVEEKTEGSLKTSINVDKEYSALFATNEENDDLFSAKNSASNLLFKKQSIFSEQETDQLFDDSENLFSGSKKNQAVIKNVKITAELESCEQSDKDESNTNLFRKSKKQPEEDLFGSNDDVLFSGKSGLGLSHNSGVGGNDWKGSRDVKFSTPTETRNNLEVPGGDNFGGVSEITSGESSNAENVSAISNDLDNSFNFARYLSVDSTKDHGFAEPSDISDENSGNAESPGLFDPKFSSTRHLPSDTSDYKTERTSSNQIHQTKSPSNMLQSQDNGKSKMGHSENKHFSRENNTTNKSKGLFDDDEDDDLFQTSKPLKTRKESSIFDEMENDDLFSNVTPRKNKNHPVFEEKKENNGVFQKSSIPAFESGLVDEEERSGLVDKVKQLDSVSMSSSRSSLFDDINVGKTNLASVFDNDKSLRNVDSLFDKSSDNLFLPKTNDFENDSVNDLFSNDSLTKYKGYNKDSTSLFDTLEDADDLFKVDVPKEVLKDDNKDLFFKSKEDKNVNNFEASPTIKSKSGSVFSDDDNIFGDTDVTNNKNKTMFDNKTKLKEINSLFGELEDEEEDLFDNTKTKEKTKSNAKNTNLTIRGETQDSNQSSVLFESELITENHDLFSVSSSGKKNIDRPKGAEEKGERSNEFLSDQNLNKSDNEEQQAKEEKVKILSNSYNNIQCAGDNVSEFNETKDLFKSKAQKSKFLENKKLFEVDEFDDNNLFRNKSIREAESLQEKFEDGLRPSPPSTLKLVNQIDLPSKQENSETDGLTISSEKPKIIGKLNIPANLKINPMNLLPGSVMKKNVPVEQPSQRAESFDSEKETNIKASESAETAPNLLKCLGKDRVKIQTRRRPQTRRARQEALRSSGTGFQFSASEVVQVAARSKSVDDFEKDLLSPPELKSQSDTNVNDSVLVNSIEEDAKVSDNADSSSSIFHSVENSPEALFSSPMVSNPLSPSTDEEDYFNVPELDVNFEKEDQSIFKSNKSSYQNVDKHDDTLLFDGAPVLSPLNTDKTVMPETEEPESNRSKPVTLHTEYIENLVSEKTRRSLIISDVEDDDDGLFKSSDNKHSRQKKTDVKSRTSSIFDNLDDNDSFLFEKKPDPFLDTRRAPKKALFEDNDEDVDLFTNKPVPSNSVTVVSSNDSTSKIEINKSVASQKSKEPFIDPLGLMANPD